MVVTALRSVYAERVVAEHVAVTACPLTTEVTNCDGVTALLMH